MSSQQSGLVAGNKQNEPGGSTDKSRSTFPLSYSFFETERFAEYTPFFVMEGVSGDRLPLHSNHEVQTYTLKSPILQNLMKKKDYFMVPMQAILPLNWEKFYTQPNIGQDVPTDCGLGVVDFWSKVRIAFDSDLGAIQAANVGTGSGDITLGTYLDMVFHFLLFYEMFYSCGSLMETLGISGHNYLRLNENGDQMTFDEMFDHVIGLVSNYITDSTPIVFTIGSMTYHVVEHPLDYYRNGYTDVTLREALELMRDDLSFQITGFTGVLSTLFTALDTYFDTVSTGYTANTDAPLNLGRLWAYQLTVAHYYSNDHVDFIYSADLFRQYVLQLVTRNSGTAVDFAMKFIVNGLEYIYDALSAFYCSRNLGFIAGGILSSPSPSSPGPDSVNDILAYFTALLSFKRSLRFMDYFTGSRALPLAVGNSAVNVVGGQVNIIDLSKRSMGVKFLQAVNRSGRKFGAYMQELFGIVPKYDYHNPMYLAHTSDLVGTSEVDNTGDAQMQDAIAVTSRFRAQSSRYAFEFTPDRDCIIVGITYYDLPRVYSRATERQNFYIDRADMFNPYLQFIGDQGIYEAEIGTDVPTVGSNFSYTNRNMEYKQRYNQCCGGFCVPSTNLGNWLFIADNLRRRLFRNISPSFIRSFNSEIDHFYQSLTGYSLGTYFHFIVRYDNRMDASRPMAFNPTISI